MNITTYLFGQFPNGYSQYPDDYTRGIFQTFKDNSQSKTQIAIHRNGDLMYYGYIRLLEGDNYIGLCAVINGHYLTSTRQLFGVFEKVVELMVRNGYFIHFDDSGEITTSSSAIYEDKEAISEISTSMDTLFGQLPSQPLPPVSYATSSESVKSFSLDDDEADVIKSGYTDGYTMLYKSAGYNTARLLAYKGVIGRMNKQIAELKSSQDELKAEKKDLEDSLAKQKLKQRNTTLVSILAIVVVIFGIVIWNKVLYPSEVTKYDTGEFVYYGPMKNGKPNGVGVAIYHDNDKDGRLYYYGNFTNGNRVDNEAILFYRDGSYFRGSMNNDQWRKGVFYDTENEHFLGEFKNNQPYKGTWYRHEPVQTLNGDE